MNIRLGLSAVVALIAASAEAGAVVRLAGRVVDTTGNPVAEARIAEWWFAEQSAPLELALPTLSGTDGRFSLEVELYNRDSVLMAIDSTGILGGLATISATSPQEPINIDLQRLVEVRFRYASEQPDLSLGETYVTVSVGDKRLRVAGGRSRAAKFAMKLPPGRCTIRGGETRHDEDDREFTLERGKDLDLGEIKLQPSKVTQLIGKPAPAWHITDARGVSKDVQPADFKGKWVVLEFWGYWCGPCVRRGLPGWIDFVDNHAADGDKFVVLAIHDPQATDFTMLDEKLKPIVRRAWHGRSLPFPILLDTSGRTVEDYGVKYWPTAVLLDPEGRVVDFPAKPFVLGSWACEDFLASKLTPLPAAIRISSALDRGLSIAVGEGETLADTLDFYGKVGRITIRLDPDELKAAGVDEKVPVPLTLGGSLTLRAWLNLTLEPFGLTYVENGDGLRIVRGSPENLRLSRPSPRQIKENALVGEALKQKVTLDFQGESLKQVIAKLETATGESFVVDPACNKSGTIDRDIRVTGSAADEPLSSALTRLLAPLGLTFVVRNEAIVLTSRH
ncbi:MAG TPA: TlpA disulfide reductase family protein [Pirellulales bacterium]|nr:TlpA disulfide reductase family protein [Pirellulales bacterium]